MRERTSNKEHKGNFKENKTANTTGFVVTQEAELMKFLIEQMPNKSRNNIKSFLRDKQILVEGQVVTQFNHILKTGEKVEVRKTKAAPEQKYRGLTIIFEDKDLIIIEKQEGMLSIATLHEKNQTAYSILSAHVKKQDPGNRIFVVHRLDRETSGLMMFAKSEKIQKLLQESWTATIMERTYLAVIEGTPEEKEGTITSYLQESKALVVYSSPNPNHGQYAVTHYDTLKQNQNFTLLKVNLETGRKNQIRVHMKDLGHSIVGDSKYGATVDPIGRLGLHAWVLSFTHPVSREKLHFETAIPKKFLSLF
ncbi:23S rRNA pseudouridine1911/1915/1917 synthase [Pseudarcicella hirudinis]|uniref:Pseudouridine synthase n=1 Tax=Pseudarcicella hirudinis TaxID=1079859 RepID=A0A1I5Z1X1_9BACT|nr:RluA family pseudouridine synthase [Pseudarcicella hirudinis]SFQ50420.1 23S rRNA pseudouridine1911/1915/1917 synthase [Pseudarcicella hirudinis]